MALWFCIGTACRRYSQAVIAPYILKYFSLPLMSAEGFIDSFGSSVDFRVNRARALLPFSSVTSSLPGIRGRHRRRPSRIARQFGHYSSISTDPCSKSLTHPYQAVSSLFQIPVINRIAIPCSTCPPRPVKVSPRTVSSCVISRSDKHQLLTTTEIRSLFSDQN